MAADPEIPEPDRLGDLPHPRTCVRVHGHGGAEALFLDAFRAGRVPPAWVLAGPRGIGKASLAYRLARFVLADADPLRLKGADSLDLPPEHPVHARVNSLGHPDLLVLRRPWDYEKKRLKTVVSVEEVRRTGDRFGKSAGEGGWRVCVLDCADELNANSANALLKVLEEPPARSLFLVVCHAPGQLLPTIRSRCRMLPLRPPPEHVGLQLLASHFPDLSGPDRLALTRLARNAPGRALEMAGAGGLELYRAMVGLIEPMPRLDVPALHAFGDRVAKGGDEAFRAAMDLLQDWLSRLLRGALAPVEPVEITPGEGEAMRRLTGRGNLDRWIELWEKVARSPAEAAAFTLDRKQVVLNAFFAFQAAAEG